MESGDDALGDLDGACEEHLILFGASAAAGDESIDLGDEGLEERANGFPEEGDEFGDRGLGRLIVDGGESGDHGFAMFAMGADDEEMIFDFFIVIEDGIGIASEDGVLLFVEEIHETAALLEFGLKGFDDMDLRSGWGPVFFEDGCHRVWVPSWDWRTEERPKPPASLMLLARASVRR